MNFLKCIFSVIFLSLTISCTRQKSVLPITVSKCEITYMVTSPKTISPVLVSAEKYNHFREYLGTSMKIDCKEKWPLIMSMSLYIGSPQKKNDISFYDANSQVIMRINGAYYSTKANTKKLKDILNDVFAQKVPPDPL